MGVAFGGVVLRLTNCMECHVVIGAAVGDAPDPLALQLGKIRERLEAIEKKWMPEG